MATKINNSADTATNRDKPVTFEEAEDLGAFELASQWADRLPWPLPQNRSASDELAELAFGMSAMMDADLGHLCALKHGDGFRELPREHWRKRAIAGCTTRRSACGIVIMGAARRQDDRDRELEVIAVETGAGREAFLPVIHARPSRIAK